MEDAKLTANVAPLEAVVLPGFVDNVQNRGRRMSNMSSEDLAASVRANRTGTLTVAEAEAVVRNLSKKESAKGLADQRTKTYKYVSMVTAFCAVVMVAVMLAVNIAANEASKESHVNKENGEMITLAKGAVRTESAVSFVPLMDLPKMPLSFLDQLEKLTFTVDGAVERVPIDGYRSSNSSVLVLWVKGGDERIVIKCGTARLYRADGTTVVDLKETHNAGAMRQLLSGSETAAKAYSMEQLVSAAAEHTEGRALGASPLTSLYAFFGGVASANMAATTANAAGSTWGDAGDDSQCVPYAGFVHAIKPTLPARSNWTLELPQIDSAGTTVWVKGTWYLAFDQYMAPMMQMESEHSPGVDTTIFHEIHGGKEYRYTTVDYWRRQASIANQPDGPCATEILSSGTTCPAYNDVLRAHGQAYLEATRFEKSDCTIQRETVNEREAEMNAANAKLLSNPGDGSGVWLVGGYRVRTDTAGNPTTIVDEDTGAITAKILSITEFHASDMNHLFQGCIVDETYTPVDEVTFTNAGLRRQLSEVSDAHLIADSIIHSAYAAMNNVELATEHNGRLLSWTSFQAWISNTNWCGAGTDLANTICPGTGPSGQDVTADRACRRHDHGAKSNGIIGGMAVRLGCDIDANLASATSNWCAQGIFGSWGLAQTWGCFDHGSYNCWNWASKWWGGYWRYGDYCNGENVRYGPWRYDGYKHSYGYKAKVKSCNDDIW